jgi:hypothetical protein
MSIPNNRETNEKQAKTSKRSARDAMVEKVGRGVVA